MRSSTPSGSTVQLALDSLESRLAPAGNLTVFVSNETLFVQSDRFNHLFTVEVHNDRMVLQTYDTTTVNGSGGFMARHEFPGDATVIRALVIDGNSSNDSVTVRDELSAARNLDVTVRTYGAGDQVFFTKGGTSLVNGLLTVDTDAGNDTLQITGNWTGCSLNAKLGGGDDTCKLPGVIGNLIALDGGTGKKDTLELLNSVYQTYRTRITGFETITRT